MEGHPGGAMRHLYLTLHPSDVVWVYSKSADAANTWELARKPQKQSWTAVLLQGQKGWVVQEKSDNRNNGKVHWLPEASAKQDEDFPPLGAWTSPDRKEKLTLSDTAPAMPQLESPLVFEAPFVTIRVAVSGSVARLQGVAHKASITDDLFEDALRWYKELLMNLGRRPGMLMCQWWDLRTATVPGMRHINRFISYAGENGLFIDLVTRGIAPVLSNGFLGSALMRIIKLVMKACPAPFPVHFVHATSDAEAWVTEVATLLADGSAGDGSADDQSKGPLPAEPTGAANTAALTCAQGAGAHKCLDEDLPGVVPTEEEETDARVPKPFQSGSSLLAKEVETDEIPTKEAEIDDKPQKCACVWCGF